MSSNTSAGQKYGGYYTYSLQRIDGVLYAMVTHKSASAASKSVYTSSSENGELLTLSDQTSGTGKKTSMIFRRCGNAR